MRRLFPLLAAVCSMWLAGCATTLSDTPALRATPDAWRGAATSPGSTTPARRWWTAFGDPTLDQLVSQAGSADDVFLAEARLAEARARLRSARGALAPTIAAGGSGSVQRMDDTDQTSAEAAGTIAFYPDLNGAARARTRSARASAEAAAARLDWVRLASRAEAVRLYTIWREGEARAAAGDRAVAALQSALALAASRERSGLASGFDAAAAAAALSAAKARPAAAREAALNARLGLEALLGINPGALTSEPPAGVPAATAPTSLRAPVSVLGGRPDLRAAERDLAAAGFDAEAARRDFWPSVSLDAAIGGRSTDPTTALTPEGALARVAGGLTAPLFTFGRLEGSRDVADARRTAAAVRYRQAAANALSEVERALASVRQAEARRTALAAAVVAASDQTRFADSRYRAGLASFIDVLTAQRGQADAEADLATAQGDVARAVVALNLATGAD